MSQTIHLSQGTLEDRFAHILQPIRDLTKNWDIDIANYLEEYLEDLAKVEITFDDGLTTMNFSEAALLIQGSAGVYAKKVEYLYSLVFQVLDLVTENKKQKSSKSDQGGDGEGADDGDQLGVGGEDGEFLTLDDDVADGNGSYRKEVDTSQNKSVRLVPETPSRFVALQEAEKDDALLYNKKGEVLGNPSDFNLDMGYITSCGSFLLELGDRALLSMQNRQTQMLGDLAEEERSGCRGDMIAAMGDGGDDDVMDDVFDGLGDVDMEAHGSLTTDKMTSKDKEKEPVRRSTRNKRVTFASSTKSAKQAPQDKLLDPYESSKAKEKPFVKKKTYKIPESLAEGKTSTKKRKKKPVVKKELKPIHIVVESLFSHRPKFPKNKLKVPEFPELDDAFWKEYKLREEDNKAKIQKLRQSGELEEGDDKDDKAEEEEEEIPQGLDDLGNDDEADDFDDRPPLNLDNDLFSGSQGLELRGIPSDTGFNTLTSDDVTMTYEDLVQMHVEKYLTSAAQYAQITDLSRRVSEWEEKITPRLEEEQAHPTFDIHKYGTDMIEQMVRGQKIPFRDLVKGMSEYQICRYTLATLQLANVYNVELTIIPSETGCIMDCLYVTLLSTKRHFESLEEYKAPSVDDK